MSFLTLFSPLFFNEPPKSFNKPNTEMFALSEYHYLSLILHIQQNFSTYICTFMLKFTSIYALKYVNIDDIMT